MRELGTLASIIKGSPKREGLMVKTVATQTKRAVKHVAQQSIEGARSVAGEALGAAATAAAGVVLESTANALEAGRTRINQSTPEVKRAVGRAATRTVSRPARRKAKATGRRKARSRKLRTKTKHRRRK
jgi:hypothetical protein